MNIKPETELPKIEKGIPLPEKGNRSSGWRNLFMKMKEGDSFVFNGKQVTNMHMFARQCGIRIVTRALPEGGRRVWHAGKIKDQP